MVRRRLSNRPALGVAPVKAPRYGEQFGLQEDSVGPRSSGPLLAPPRPLWGSERNLLPVPVSPAGAPWWRARTPANPRPASPVGAPISPQDQRLHSAPAASRRSASPRARSSRRRAFSFQRTLPARRTMTGARSGPRLRTNWLCAVLMASTGCHVREPVRRSDRVGSHVLAPPHSSRRSCRSWVFGADDGHVGAVRSRSACSPLARDLERRPARPRAFEHARSSSTTMTLPSLPRPPAATFLAAWNGSRRERISVASRDPSALNWGTQSRGRRDRSPSYVLWRDYMRVEHRASVFRAPRSWPTPTTIPTISEPMFRPCLPEDMPTRFETRQPPGRPSAGDPAPRPHPMAATPPGRRSCPPRHPDSTTISSPISCSTCPGPEDPRSARSTRR